MTRAIWPLQRRVMLAFSAFALLLAALYGLYALVFMYAVEDSFFAATLEQEAIAQQRSQAQTGQWVTPRDDFVRVYTRPEDFPRDLVDGYREEPWRNEFAGQQGRHYHVLAMPAPDGAAAWLVAEVSRKLVVRPMRHQVLLLLAVTSGVVVLLALGTGYWLAAKTTRPLSRLVARVEAMSPERLPLGLAQEFGNDEAGVLARGLEALAQRVHAFTRREREFTRDASHELRTPLAVIRGSTERLAAEPGLSAAASEQVAHIRQSAWQLEQTIITLLSLAREAEAPDAPACVPLLPVLERVVVEQSLLLEGKQVDVDVDVPRNAVIEAPATVAHILLSNLIGNAFTHTQAGEVRIDLQGNRLRIANRSEGGDPPMDTADAVTARPGSSGLALGLSIVRRLCARYGLEVDMRQIADTFTVELSLLRGTEEGGPATVQP
jgi:signal transduction histidine kinase